MAATAAATRAARAVPPARPTSPPSTTRPGSSTTQTEATPTATRCARSSRNAEDSADGEDTAAWTASAAVEAGEAVAGRELAHRGAADQPLEAAAGRVPDVGVQRSAVHRQVADLARRPGRAAVQPAAEHGGQAQADAHPHQDEVVRAGGGARGPFGHRGQVHVVLDHDRLVQDATQGVQGALVPRGQVHRQPRVTGLRVDHARTADDQRAEPGEVHPGAGAGPLDDPADQGSVGSSQRRLGSDAHRIPCTGPRRTRWTGRRSTARRSGRGSPTIPPGRVPPGGPASATP